MVRIEDTVGYEPGMPIVTIGEVSETERPKLNPELSELESITGISTENSLVNSIVMSVFSKYFIGDQMMVNSKELKTEILRKIDADAMPIYPRAGSIQVVDGVLVLRLG